MPMLTTERHGAVQTIRLDNPPYNFLTSTLMSELHTLLTTIDADAEIRAVVLTSAVQDVFVSHYDVSEILAGAEAAPVSLTPRTANAALRASGIADKVPGGAAGLAKAGAGGVADLRLYHQVCRLIRESSTVFIAAINGRAMGGGCELALACDIRLMADGPYEIGQPEVLVGIIPGGGGTQMLARTVGTTRALELCLEGAPIMPAQALEIGLITRLVAPEELLAEAHTTATRLATRSPNAVRAIKTAIHKGGSTTLERGLQLERSEFLAAASTASAKRAMAAYLADVTEVSDNGGGLEDFIADRLPAWLDGTRIDFDR